jgi:hypothetical protein
MSRIVTGRLYYPDSTTIVSTTLKLVAKRHNYSSGDGGVPYHAEIEEAIDASGDFSIDVPAGEYDVRLLTGGSWYSIGAIVVNAADTANITLAELIELSRDDAWDANASETWATKAYVDSALACGRDPGTLPITDLGVGTLADGEMVVRQGAALASAPWYVVNPANNADAESGGTYAITAGNTLNLPPTPSSGMWVRLLPYTSWESVNSTLGDGTDTINGSVQSITLDVDCICYFVYVGGSTGWSLLQTF